MALWNIICPIIQFILIQLYFINKTLGDFVNFMIFQVIYLQFSIIFALYGDYHHSMFLLCQIVFTNFFIFFLPNIYNQVHDNNKHS